MALNSTIYKADLQISNMDCHYYQLHKLTIAKHPSETDERLMIRLLSFAMFAADALTFGKDISADDEPALWQTDLTGAIELWIEIGQPDERIIRKACGRSNQVVLMLYGRSSELWWKNNQTSFTGRTNLKVILLSSEETQALAKLANRNMSLTCTIEDDEVSLIDEKCSISIKPVILFTGKTIK
ncbi:MAG: YaeQ family protein [Candidatus Riflemargulisbacteria bacterium]